MSNNSYSFYCFSKTSLWRKFYQTKYLFSLMLCFISISSTTLAAPADLDSSFGSLGKVVSNPNGTASYTAKDAALQSDGKIVMIGSDDSGTALGFIVVRYNSDGSLDTTFGTNGWVFTTIGKNADKAVSVAIQADGKIVGGVTATSLTPSNVLDFGIVRFNADGSLDTTFDDDGKAVVSFDPETLPDPNLLENLGSLKIANDGKIILGGTAQLFPSPTRLLLARLNPDGSLDTTFGTNGKVVTREYGRLDELNDVEVLPDGSIFVAGASGGTSTFWRMVIKYDVSGNEVWAYMQSSLINNTQSGFFDIAFTSDGKIIAAGSNGNRSMIARINADGTHDPTFVTPTGAIGQYDDIAIQSDGKILTTHYSVFQSGSSSRFSLIRYNANGSYDTSFGNGGRALTNVTEGRDEGNKIMLQPDGKILVGGYSTIGSPAQRYFTLIRYQGGNVVPQTPRFDYDGDGKADISVFRPSNGVWYLNQSTNGFSATQFGISSDRIVPSDFDGDGKTDIAIYRDGVWWILQSSDSSVKVVQFGIAEDKPQSGDFDGDGKDDLVVFRPSTGVWYVLRSSDSGFYGVQFGLSEDVPQSADYDGDGITDLAVFRPSNGTWYVQKSLGVTSSIQFGSNGDIPTANDFDGDGNTDIAVWRPSNGDWYILKSSSNQVDKINFGLMGDIPVAADYDGDTKADIAIFRPTNGVWYQKLSTQGNSQQVFGLNNDRPTPGAYNP